MIYPIVINPDFLIQAKNDEKILDNLSSFVKLYKEYWKDIFILVDDEKNTLTKKYQEIKTEYGHENFILNIILDILISSKKTKKVNLKIDITKKNLAYLLNNLKINKVKKIITFPEYFEGKQISLKDIIEKKPFSKMTTDEAIERITSITRFSKNITLIDPMLPYTISNINYIKNINYLKMTDEESDIIYSLKKLINEIYRTNFFKDSLKINIRTTINNSKIKHLKDQIENNIYIKNSFKEAKNNGKEEFLVQFYKNKKKYINKFNTIEIDKKKISLIKKKEKENESTYNDRVSKSKIYTNAMSDEEIDNQINHWNNIGEKIKNFIEDSTFNIVESIKPNIVINAHYKTKENSDEPEQDIYDRHILSIDLDYSMEIRKGFDIFNCKSGKLKNITSWYLKLDTGIHEKSASYYIFSHKKYVPQKIIYN